MNLTWHQIVGLRLLMEDMDDQELVKFFTESDYLFKGEGVSHLVDMAIDAQNRIDEVEETEEVSEINKETLQQVEAEVKAEATQKVVQREASREVSRSSHYTEEQTRAFSLRILEKRGLKAAIKALEMDFRGASRQRLQWISDSLQKVIDSKKVYDDVMVFLQMMFERAADAIENAVDDDGEFEAEIAPFEAELASQEKEFRRQKAVAALRKNGHEEVADVLLGEKDPEYFFDELKAADDSKDIVVGIKKEWIYPLIREIEGRGAARALNDWALEISGAVCVLDEDADRQDAFEAKEALQRAWSVDLRSYFRHIEEIVVSGEFPEEMSQLFTDSPELAEVVLTAQNAEQGTKASALINGIREVIHEAIGFIFDQEKPGEAVSASRVTKTQEVKEIRPNGDAERRARQLQRAAESLAMKGSNSSADKRGAGKKSKRAENDPHRGGK